MNLYLLRHGTTHWNALHRIQGRSDIPLDAAGKEIARQSGAELAARGIRFAVVYSSPLLRARRTAELVAQDAPITICEGLREVCFGEFEGRTVAEMMAEPGCAFRYFKSEPSRYDEEVRRMALEGAADAPESLTALRGRAAIFLQEVLEPGLRTLPADSNVLIAGHGAMNKALLMVMQKNEDLRSFWGKGLQANCGFHIISAVLKADGAVSYQAEENCRIYYDPAVLQGFSNLL